MKTIASLVLATLTFTAVPAAQAHDYGRTSIIISSSSCIPHCAPRYVCTKELCRRYECRSAYDQFGCRHSYHVLVITYADYYSDGSARSYTRAFRA
jgi:hypothetical protein